MEEVMEFKTYEEFEQQVTSELSKQAESFVRLGYLMKIARDTDILKESGYANVTEFAADKYNLTKDQVSRFIHINDKFSKGGYSEELEDQFKGYGYSKLSVMLTLPEAVVNVLTPRMTRNQIVEVQKEYKEEQTISPLEAMIEQKNPVQQEMRNDLEKFVHQYGYDNRERFGQLAGAREKAGDFAENIIDVIAPSGIASITERIKGTGKLLLSIKGKDEPIQLVNMRAETTETYQWTDMLCALEIYKDGSKETWEELYGEEFKKDEGEKQDDKERVYPENNQSGVKEESVNTKDDTKTEKKSEQTEQDAGQISGRGAEPVIVKLKATTEELKDKLFRKWFEYLSEEKIEAACKLATHMRFKELINITPKKLLLLVQTCEVNTEEIIENGQIFTRVEDEEMEGEFSSQDFQKRFNREYLEPYKMQELEEKQEEKREVAPVQQESTEQPEEQVPGQKHIDDYKECAPDDGYKSFALRVIPGDDVYCIVDYTEKEGRKNVEKEGVERGVVDHITIGSSLIPQIEVCNDENTWTTYDQAEDWGEIIFKTQEAAERKLKEQQADEEKC